MAYSAFIDLRVGVGAIKTTQTIESTTIMSMPDTLELGSVTYTKQSQDAVTGVHYEVEGGTLQNRKTVSFKTLLDKSGTRRTLIDLSHNKSVPGSTNGAFKTARVYLNVVIPGNWDPTEIVDTVGIAQLTDLLALETGAFLPRVAKGFLA